MTTTIRIHKRLQVAFVCLHAYHGGVMAVTIPMSEISLQLNSALQAKTEEWIVETVEIYFKFLIL